MIAQLDRASKWYGNVVAVNDISFTLEPGVTGLLGPNGAGKSSILHMLAGLSRPSSGAVTVNGIPSWQHPEMHRVVGFVAENDAVYQFLSGMEFVLLNARLHQLGDPHGAARRAIALVDLERAADRSMAGYSKGMRQRAKIAAMMVHSPPVLLLDEPFNGMDPRQRLELMALLQRLAADDGATVLVSSHILEEVDRLASNVLVIVGGRLAATGSSRVIRQLMTDRPHTFTLRTSDNRALASMLARQEWTTGIEFHTDGFTVRTAELGTFARALPRLARDAGISIVALDPADESLESVFAYLVDKA